MEDCGRYWAPGIPRNTFLPTQQANLPNLLASTQVALAEARAAYEMLDKDAKINEQRFQNREKDLMKELNDLKMSSLKDTKRLEAKLDYLARERAALKVKLEQAQLQCDFTGAEKRSQVKEIKEELARKYQQCEVLRRQVAAQEVQLQHLERQQDGGRYRGKDGQSSTRDEAGQRALIEVKALRKERLELLAESTRIWKDLAEARAELALERQLCKEHHRHAVLLALERASLLKLLKSTRKEADKLKSGVSLGSKAATQAQDPSASAPLPLSYQPSSPPKPASRALTMDSMTEAELLGNLSLVTYRATSLSASLPCSPHEELHAPSLEELQSSLRESLKATQAAAGVLPSTYESFPAASLTMQAELLGNLSFVMRRAASLSASFPCSPHEELHALSLEELQSSLRESLKATQAAAGVLPSTYESFPAASLTMQAELLGNLSFVMRRAASLSASLPCSPHEELHAPSLEELQSSLRESLKATQAAAGGDAAERARREMHEAFESSCTHRIAASVHAGFNQHPQSPTHCYATTATYFDPGLPVMRAIGPIFPPDTTVRVHKEAHYSPSAVSPVARPPAPKTPHSSHGFLSRGDSGSACAASHTSSLASAKSPPQSAAKGLPRNSSTASSATVARDAASAAAAAPSTPRTSRKDAVVLPPPAAKSAASALVTRNLPHVCVTPGRSDDSAGDARGVSFPNGFKDGERHRVMRSEERSPGCTPVVALGSSPSGRVRVQSRPGHDNFAPLKSATASPGGTPHAHGQGRQQGVRVVSSAIPGHVDFNPLISEVASPGHTPVPSIPDSAGSPGPDSQIAAHHAGRVIISAHRGHDNFNPLVLQDASPGHTPLPGPAATAAARHAQGARVTIDSEAGHDNFKPMHELDASPGCTPMHTSFPRRASAGRGDKDGNAAFTEDESVQSVEAGYSGDAHRTSITLAAERALSGCAAVRTRLVPSPRAQDPRSYPVLIDSSTAGEGARALLSERDLRLSLSLVEAAASVTDAVVQSYRAINGRSEPSTPPARPPLAPTGSASFVMSPARPIMSMTELSVSAMSGSSNVCGRRGRVSRGSVPAAPSSSASPPYKNVRSPPSDHRASSGLLHTHCASPSG